MKKSIGLLLIVALSLSLLCGCDEIDNFYTVKVTGDVSSLITPIMPFYQAGKVVEIKAHPVTDVSLHVFVNGERIPMSHFDSDYWGFAFVMPEENVTIHLTYDQFYGRDEYSFDELCWNIDNLENEITKVSVRTTDYKNKNMFIETRYSYKREDIDNFKAIVNQRLIKYEGSSSVDCEREFSFYYDMDNNREMLTSLYFRGDLYWWNDFSSYQLFRFEDTNYCLPTIEDPDFVTYSFKYDGLSSDVKKYDDESFAIRYFNIDSIEFIPCEGESLDTNSPFYLDSRYGKINLISQTVFELNGEYYEIVSGVEYWAYNYCQLEGK